VSNFEWLLKEAVADLAVPASPRFVVADETWQATIERVMLAPGLQVFLNDIRIHRDLRAEPMDHRPANFLTGQVAIAGRADIDLLDGTTASANRKNSVLYRLPGRLGVFSFKAGTRYHSAGYALDPGRVERLLDGEVPAILRPLLDRDLRQSRAVTAPADKAMRTLAGNLFARGLNGPLRRLMMEGVVLQLLAVQAAAAAEQPLARQRSVLTQRERRAVGEARERLLADMRQPPTLGDLADAVGLTEKRLNTGFRLMFGATVFEVLRNERLEHAREALEEGTGSLKEVSFRVGYNHVSNFVHAFRARYDAPPRQYLEGMRAK
jgi:AraC-like DNA-binding protein